MRAGCWGVPEMHAPRYAVHERTEPLTNVVAVRRELCGGFFTPPLRGRRCFARDLSGSLRIPVEGPSTWRWSALLTVDLRGVSLERTITRRSGPA